MRKRIPNDFGRAVLGRLVELGMTQAELSDKVVKKYGLFLDSGYLYKVMTGQRNAPKIVEAICEILKINDTSN